MGRSTTHPTQVPFFCFCLILYCPISVNGTDKARVSALVANGGTVLLELQPFMFELFRSAVSKKHKQFWEGFLDFESTTVFNVWYLSHVLFSPSSLASSLIAPA